MHTGSCGESLRVLLRCCRVRIQHPSKGEPDSRHARGHQPDLEPGTDKSDPCTFPPTMVWILVVLLLGYPRLPASGDKSVVSSVVLRLGFPRLPASGDKSVVSSVVLLLLGFPRLPAPPLGHQSGSSERSEGSVWGILSIRVVHESHVSSRLPVAPFWVRSSVSGSMIECVCPVIVPGYGEPVCWKVVRPQRHLVLDRTSPVSLWCM